MLNPGMITERIQTSHPDATVHARDLTGGGDHWDVVVISEAFEGKRLVQRHKLIYACFEEELKSGILHALALKTWTPTQWADKQGS